MAIEFRCPCGAACSADESQVGHLFHCEACGLDIPVPAPGQIEDSGAQADHPADAGEVAAVLDEGHDEAAREMVHQVQETQLTDPAEVAAKHEADLAALGQEAAAGADVAEVGARHKASIEALHEQLGSRGGSGEMAEQMRAVREGKGGVPGAGALAAELGPRKARPASKGPPKGKARAAHHIGFKRAIWLPSLAIGLVCLVLGGYCFFASPSNPYEKHLERFWSELKEAGIGEFEVVRHQGKAWAIPKGAAHTETVTGRVFFQNVPLYGDKAPDEPAVEADDYVKSQDYQGGQQSRYLSFGLGLLAVGLALVVLSLWVLHDVRLMRGDKAPETAKPADAPVADGAAQVPAEGQAEEPPIEAELADEEEGPADVQAEPGGGEGEAPDAQETPAP
ncbi:MAG: hypothetical protein IMZ66_07290 [Planctomycetes bacterium]|nr:hypothetical protein [Planctomycetota bacterium]